MEIGKVCGSGKQEREGMREWQGREEGRLNVLCVMNYHFVCVTAPHVLLVRH